MFLKQFGSNEAKLEKLLCAETFKNTLFLFSPFLTLFLQTCPWLFGSVTKQDFKLKKKRHLTRSEGQAGLDRINLQQELWKDLMKTGVKQSAQIKEETAFYL